MLAVGRVGAEHAGTLVLARRSPRTNATVRARAAGCPPPAPLPEVEASGSRQRIPAGDHLAGRRVDRRVGVGGVGGGADLIRPGESPGACPALIIGPSAAGNDLRKGRACPDPSFDMRAGSRPPEHPRETQRPAGRGLRAARLRRRVPGSSRSAVCPHPELTAPQGSGCLMAEVSRCRFEEPLQSLWSVHPLSWRSCCSLLIGFVLFSVLRPGLTACHSERRCLLVVRDPPGHAPESCHCGVGDTFPERCRRLGAIMLRLGRRARRAGRSARTAGCCA